MRDELLKALAPREEKFDFLGQTVTLREMGSAQDTEKLRELAPMELTYRSLVHCVIGPDGNPVFTDADIPALKKASPSKLLPLIAAVARVNGFNIEAEEKNSEADPSSG